MASLCIGSTREQLSWQDLRSAVIGWTLSIHPFIIEIHHWGLNAAIVPTSFHVGSNPCAYRMTVQDLFPASAFIILTLLAAGLIHKISKIGQREPLLPPGPATTPILGNIAILPKKDSYVTFNEWAKQYGEIFSLKVGPKTMIVLSSAEAINQVMDKNGLITANKPSLAHRVRIFGDDGAIGSVDYGKHLNYTCCLPCQMTRL